MAIRKLAWPMIAVVAIAGGAYFGTVWAPWSGTAVHADAAVETAKPTPPVQPEASATVAELSRAFRTVHNAIKDAVVNIDTTRKMPVATKGHTQLPDDIRKMLPPGFEFNAPDEDTPSLPGGSPRTHSQLYGTGSGVIVSGDGYILTNNHVVEGADGIVVRLDDGRELNAKVVGRDPKSDLAVVKVEAEHLTYAKLGDSDALDVGDWVLAFGSPFGFDQTMTQGIISAKGRSQVHIIGSNNPNLRGLTYENFLQTDAAINPGNSGGPLVNLKGEVVGINTAIASRTGAYNGIGFSIPSNDAKYIMDSLIKNGKVVRGYMGVGILDVHDTQGRTIAKELGYTERNGVIIQEVKPDSPGGKGGLKLEDIITSINGKPVQDIQQLRNEVARTAPGSNIALTVFREGKAVDVAFPVGTQPDIAGPVASGASEKPAVEPSNFNDLGITVAEQNKSLVITEVDPNGLAAEFGLTKGDVLRGIQGRSVKTLDDLKAVINKNKSNNLRLSVRGADGSDRLIVIEKDKE